MPESPDPEHIEWVTVVVPPVKPDREDQSVDWAPQRGETVTVSGAGVVADVDDQGVLVRVPFGGVARAG